jgi:carbamoyl-phosphate synthase large subunit
MDFFYKDGQYYLSEINPRFGGAYLHAYGAGVDFIKLIEQNLKGKVNTPHFGDYEDGVVMMMYDSVVIKGQAELAE